MRPLATRRDLLKTAAASATLATLPNAHAGGDDLLRVASSAAAIAAPGRRRRH